jgi:hypothetical protein
VGRCLLYGAQTPYLRGSRIKADQIEERTQREKRDRYTEKRETEEGSKTQIKEDPSSRSKEEPERLRDTTSEGPSTL